MACVSVNAKATPMASSRPRKCHEWAKGFCRLIWSTSSIENVLAVAAVVAANRPVKAIEQRGVVAVVAVKADVVLVVKAVVGVKRQRHAQSHACVIDHSDEIGVTDQRHVDS